jgi:pimeloyl-ACP methyl ester carboxylesterase
VTEFELISESSLSETLDVLGATVPVWRGGSGSPLLYLHGDEGLLFAGPILERLSRDFEVIAPLLPGWSRNLPPKYMTRVPDLADFVPALVDALGLGSVTLVGSSVGGWVAAEAALRCSHRLDALVVISPLGAKFIDDRTTRAFLDVAAVAPLDARVAMYGADSQGVGADIRTLSPENVTAVMRSQEALARYAWSPYLHDPKLRHRLHFISAPTLVVGGSDDRFVLDPTSLDSWKAAIGSNAELVSIAGGGHRLEEEQPEALGDLIVEFAKDKGAGSQSVHAAADERIKS